MSKKNFSPLTAAVGAAFLASASVVPMASADQNPFAAQDLSSGYQLAAKSAEGSCGGKKETAEGSCGGEKAATEKADAEGKCGEGKTEGKTETETKSGTEGKCGGAA